MDFRSNPEEFDYEVRPQVSSGQLYTDEEFGLQVAMGKEHNRKPLEWKRPPVSVASCKTFCMNKRYFLLAPLAYVFLVIFERSCNFQTILISYIEQLFICVKI